MSGFKVICLGEAMIEVSLDQNTPAIAGIGHAGDTLNTAIYLKRQAPGLRVAYATKLGADQLSDGMVAMMQAEGLETDLVLRSKTRLPGLYAISIDDDGERSFLYWRDASAARRMFAAPGLSFAALGTADMLYFSAITLAILPPDHRQLLLDWLPGYRAAGGIVAFDSNYRPALWGDIAVARQMISTAWSQTDIALPGLDDEIALFGDQNQAAVIARLASQGVTTGALKRGALGPVALDGTTLPVTPAPRVVDSTAAGDSFNAAYLAAHLAGHSQAECLRAGHSLACQVIAVRGAILPGSGATP